MLALKEQVVAWHANSLAPALGLSGAVPKVLSPAIPPSLQQTTAQAVDVVIVTIREDENRAVLNRLPDRVFRSCPNRTYAVGRVRSRYGAEYSVAVIRTPEQGPNAAQDTARDAIEDLKPRWILVIGIAGAIPDREFTLGDVIVGTRLHDFTVGALLEKAPPEFTNQGGPMTKEVQDLVALLPALEDHCAGWKQKSVLGCHDPP